MTDKEEIDFAFQWIDDHEDDMGFLPANFLAFAKDFIEAQNKSQKSAIPIVRLSSLTDDWFNKQVEYERIASEKEDDRHAAKFNGKSQATRDCWKELQRIIEDEA